MEENDRVTKTRVDEEEDERDMDLTKHVPKKAILPALKATTKVEVLREMSEALLAGKLKSLRGPVLEQIVSRESLESTALGRGIALPHARTQGLDDLICGIGVSKKGVDFRAVDQGKVHLVFLTLYPPAKQSVYLNFVAGVVRALHGTDRVREMREAGDAKAVLDVLGRGVGETMAAEKAAVRKKAGIGVLDGDGIAGAELFLLARLELYGDMLEGATKGKAELQRRMEGIRALVSRRVLNHYDRLKRRPGPALATCEGGVCQGCLMKLPSQQAQRLLKETKTVATCGHCHRFLYPI